MKSFRLTFTVNGKRTEQIVYAHTIGDAKRIIKVQYAGANIMFISTGREYI